MRRKISSKRAKQIGNESQRKSKIYILSTPSRYGVIIESWRVHIVNNDKFGTDLFSIVYGKYLNKDGEEVNLRAGWDIMVLPSGEQGANTIFLVQVKTNSMPDPLYVKTLANVKVPPFVKKELHIWESGNNYKPIIIEL